MDTTLLATEQDKYEQIYRAGKDITAEQFLSLKNHVWVMLASKLAPSNLVIRQWCLIDLFSHSPDHSKKIFKMINLLSYKKDNNGMRIWAEGGTYFVYTMNILDLWIDRFDSAIILSDMKNLLSKIKKGFGITAYVRNNQSYYAPFGDIRDTPIDPSFGLYLQEHNQIKVAIIFKNVLDKNSVQYTLKARPIRFNLHVPKEDETLLVMDGIPIGFQFYTGWDKKYKKSSDEIWDMLSFKRLKSFFFI
jgi:hypothetical protein